VRLDIDGNIITLGEQNSPVEGIINDNTGNTFYISATEKARLPKVLRKPYYHFIIDISANNKGGAEKYIAAIDEYLKMHPLPEAKHKISLTNFDTKTFDIDGNWKEILKATKPEGGFYLERAIRDILIDLYKKQGNTFPLIIVLAEDIDKAIIRKNLAAYSFTYPESDRFYHLSPEGEMESYTMFGYPSSAGDTMPDIYAGKPVIKFEYNDNTVFLPADNRASIIVSPDAGKYLNGGIRARIGKRDC